MTDKKTASKLMERVNDWQSYLGQTETPRDTPAAENLKAPVPTAESVPIPEIEAPTAPDRSPQATATIVEVVPPAPAPRVENNGSAYTTATLVEVLPPDRPAKNGNRSHPRQVTERELKGVLFNDTRHAESEYNHARRANAVLSVFVIMLLCVLFTVVSWIVVD